MVVYVYPADTYGCGHYRLIWVAEALRAQGHDVRVMMPNMRNGIGGEINSRTGQLVNANVPADADVVVMQRVSLSHLASAIPLIRAKGVAVVVDMDDDLTKIDPSNPAFWAMRTDTGDRRHTWRNAHQACLQATLVTVSTPALLPVYAPHGRGVVIENRIPARYLDTTHDVSNTTVGWAGSTHSHPLDLQEVGPAIGRLLREGQTYRGVGPVDGLRNALGLSEDPAVTGSVDLTEWAAAVASIGVGLVPLADTAFNAGKCVDSSMRITTSRGVIAAGEIEPGMSVWCDRWRAVEAVEHAHARPGVLITTESGYQLRLTPEHRMFVNGNWMPAGEIIVGDAMAMEPESVGPQANIHIPWPADSRMTRREDADRSAFLTATDGPRLELTPRWGRFLGAFVGDGSCGQKTQLTISCDGQDADWIALLMDDIRAFGLHPGTQARTTYNGTVLRRRSVVVSSAHLLRVLASLGLTSKRASGQPIRVPCVPEIIWRSPREVIAEFLAGYFEADGTWTHSGVSVTSKTEELIRDVQRLLLLFGIESRRRFKPTKAQNGFRGSCWELTLRRAAADVFAKEIGFRSARKIARLAEIVGRPHSNAYRPMAWLQKVTSIEPCTVTPVDIQVEGSVFIAAGFVSHNSWLKGLEMAACGVPWVASPRAEYTKLQKALGVGLLADRPKDWYRQIKRLCTDDTLRVEQSEAGWEAARAWTIEGNAWKWLDVWDKAQAMQRATRPRPLLPV